MTDQPRKIEYRHGLGNVNDFMIAWIFGNLFTWQKLLGAGIVTTIVAGITWLGAPERFDWTTLIGMFVVASVFYFVMMPLISWALTLFTLGVGKQRKMLRTIEITPEDIASSAQDTQVTMKWSAVHRVHSTRNTILIFTTRNCAYIIPKSAFATSQAANDFAADARTHWQAAKATKVK